MQNALLLVYLKASKILNKKTKQSCNGTRGKELVEASLCLKQKIKTPLACSILQVPLYNSYEALDMERLALGDNRLLRLDKLKPKPGKAFPQNQDCIIEEEETSINCR